MRCINCREKFEPKVFLQSTVLIARREKNTNQQKWLKLRSQNQKQFQEYLQKEIRRPQIHGTTNVFLGKKKTKFADNKMVLN
jgi:DNA-binding protein H-NS